MTKLQHRIWVVSAFACLFLGLAILTLEFYKHHLETVLTTKQAERNKFQTDLQVGIVSQRLVTNIIQDLVPLAATKPEVQTLLTRYGVSVKKPSNGNP